MFIDRKKLCYSYHYFNIDSKKIDFKNSLIVLIVRNIGGERKSRKSAIKRFYWF